MDIRQLRYFIRVAELGSFSRAALMLDIGQPSLSRQIRQLEVELRQNLLIRNGRGVEPTEAGNVLLELGRGIMHQMDRVYEELGRVEGSLAGRVSVGLPPTWARLVVLRFTRLLQQELPHASVAVTEGPSVNLRDNVLHGNDLNSPALTAVALLMSSSVCPSGSDFATTSPATTPPAPGLLSMITLWRRPSPSLFATARAVRSAIPPGPNGTMMRMGFDGKDWAFASVGSSVPMALVARKFRLLIMLVCLLFTLKVDLPLSAD